MTHTLVLAALFSILLQKYKHVLATLLLHIYAHVSFRLAINMLHSIIVPIYILSFWVHWTLKMNILKN